MSGGRKQEGLMHVLWQCTNPSGITEMYFFMKPQHLVFKHNTASPHLISPKIHHICRAWAHQSNSLSAKMSSTISNLAPSTCASVENHFTRAVLTARLMIIQEPALKHWESSYLPVCRFLCTSNDNRIQRNSKGSWKSRKWNGLSCPALTRQWKQILGRDGQWGLETSSSSVLHSSVRPRHPVTADFILEVPLGKK